MEASDDGFEKRKPVPTLTRQNEETWFRLMRIYLIGKELWTDTTEPTLGLLHPQHRLDLVKDAKAQFILIQCIGTEDKERTADETTAKDIWVSLWKKYKKKLKTTGRQYIEDWATYKKSPDKSIDETWTEISSLARKIKETQPGYEVLATVSARIQSLLKSLPDEYSVIRDTIDTQGETDHEVIIQKLQEKEAELSRKATTELTKSSETAMYAKRHHHRHHSSSSNASMPDAPRSKGEPRRKARPQRRSPGCFICESLKHGIRDCPYLEKFKKYVGRRKAKDKRVKKEEKEKKKQHAFVAEDGDSDVWTSDSDLNDLDEEELAALSKEMVSSIPKKAWIADTGASSPMTDDLELFRGPLKPIRRRVIKVGGGRLYSDKCGLARVQDRKGKTRLVTALYVPGLGVNLLSVRRLCEMGLKGSFDENGLYMRDRQGQLVLRAPVCNGVYIVDKVTKGLDEIALIAAMAGEVRDIFTNDETALPSTEPLSTESSITDVELGPQSTDEDSYDSSKSNTEDSSTSVSTSKLEEYRLWHRRFAHMGKAKLGNLHNVTTLKKPIPIVEDPTPCKVCCTTKLTNSRNKRLAIRKPFVLALVSIDICGELPTSWQGYRYFLKVVDNHSRRTWIILLKKRSDAVEALRKWRLIVELRTGAKLLAVRSDNALELKFILDKWCRTIGIEPQYTEAYTSRQNGVPERDIRTTENNVRAMIKEAGLPIEFWPEAAMTDAYIRNRVGTGPVLKDEKTTPMEAFEGVKPSIDHIRTWGCVCYSPVDPKSLPIGTRKDKFMDRGRRCVFMGYVEETEKQYWMWSPDLRRVIKHHKVKFSENEKWGSEELNLPFQTANELPIRRPAGRPRKVLMPAEEGHIEPQITPEPATGHANLLPNEATAQELTQDGNDFDHMDIEEERTYDTPDPDTSYEVPQSSEENESEHSDSPEPQPTRQSTRQRASNYLNVFVPKRKRSGLSDEEVTEHRDKVLRAMTALLAQEKTTGEDSEWAFSAGEAFSPEQDTRLVIPVPDTYDEAIKDPIWGKLWLEAIQAELTALVANGTWDVVVPPTDANIVTSKWVFKAKMHIDGSLEKLKARLVARGFSQIWNR